MAKKSNKSIVKQITEEYVKNTDFKIVNEVLEDKGMNDFEMNKTTLMNIAEWSLNGDSEKEIRTKLDLNEKQWGLLCSLCPTIIFVMKHSKSLAETLLVGTIFETAIGGKRVKKCVPKALTEYDDRGKPCGQHIVMVETWEELPPNPALLKYLAEKKLNEKLGEKPLDDSHKFKEVVERLTDEERQLIAATKPNDLGDN